MKKNIRIAKELVRLAKNLVAHGVYDRNGNEYAVKNVSDAVTIVVMRNIQNGWIERYTIENGVPKSNEHFDISFLRIMMDDRCISPILKSAKSKTHSISNSLLQDLMLENESRKKKAISNGYLDRVKKEYEENPEQARDLYDRGTFEEFVEFKFPSMKLVCKNRENQNEIVRKVFDMVLNREDVNDTYEFKTGLFNYRKTQATKDDIPNWKITFLTAYDFNTHGQMTKEQVNALFNENSDAQETPSGLNMEVLKRLLGENSGVVVGISRASRKLESVGLSFLLYGDVLPGKPVHESGMSFGMSYDMRRDLVTVYELGLDVSNAEQAFIHELGHRYYYKYMSESQKEEFNKAYETKKRHFSSLKKGDTVELENGSVLTVEESKPNRIILKSKDSMLDLRNLGSLKDKIKKINGVDFLYEANGIPSNYALADLEEFVSECLCAWIDGKFQGELKEFFDKAFKK